MKTIFEHINCKDKILSQEEYNSLRSEINLHIEHAYKQGFTLASIILVYFAAIFAFYYDLRTVITTSNTYTGLLIAFVVVILCGIPTLIIYPFSIKFHDNIRAITCIATYCRVFHEYPSMISHSNKKIKEFKSWELIHCNSMIPNGNWIAFEYHIISAFAIVLTIVLGCISCISVTGFNFMDAWHIIGGIILVLLSLLYIAFLIVVFCKSLKNLKLAKLCAAYENLFFTAYKQEAIDIGLLSQEEASELVTYRERIISRDRNLVDKFTKI